MTADESRLLPNSRLNRDTPYAHIAVDPAGPGLSLAAGRAARAEVESWPGYRITPLFELPAQAAALGLGRISYKHEGGRFPPGSFKTLGAPYSLLRRLRERIAAEKGVEASAAEIIAGDHADVVSSLTACCATDGNLGRALAWGSRIFGNACRIYIHQEVSHGRELAIAGFGAEVVRVPDNYDAAVNAAFSKARAEGWLYIPDTAEVGMTEAELRAPKDVMQGYSVMFGEVDDRLGADRPTHIFVQSGVGGLPAALIAHVWELYGQDRPKIISIEPPNAACCYASAEAGRIVTLHGSCETIMAGLACNTPSSLAWGLMDAGIDAFMICVDAAVPDAMKSLVDGAGGDPVIVAGETGAAGLASLRVAAMRDDMRVALGLDETSHVLIFGTEGATDPMLYEKIIGRPAASIVQS